MKILKDERFRAELLRIIAKREFNERTGVHSSDLIYCINKQALRKSNPIPETDSQILLFSLGWATQRWLTGKLTDADEVEVDGIKVTPDDMTYGFPWELKATYTTNTKPIEDSPQYVRQCMSQCYVTKTLVAKLSRLEILGNKKWLYHTTKPETLAQRVAEFGVNWADHPTLTVFSLEFTQEELDRFWAWMVQRRDQYLEIIRTGILMPKALAVAPAQEWECSYCSYKDKCI